jgi:hypothetical protein
MRVLKQIVNGPGDLKRYFPAELSAEQLFLPDAASLSVGENLCVWFHLPRHHADIYLQGLVMWKRPRSSRALAAGCGISVRPGQMAELSFLDRVMNRTVPPLPERRHIRTPILTPWSCKVVVPDIQMWSPAEVLDISPGGARIHADMMPVHQGAVVQLGLSWHSGSTHDLQVVWFQVADGRVRLGLNRLPKATIHENEWKSLVQRALQAFESEISDG